MTLNTSMANSGGGYGVVFRCASHHCDAFHAYTRLDCADVEELLPGTKVLVLPHTPADSGWAPVVVSDRAGGARFTWHHPECIKLFALSDLGGKVTVGHLLERGRSSPSHNITTQRCGVSRTESHGLLITRCQMGRRRTRQKRHNGMQWLVHMRLCRNGQSPESRGRHTRIRLVGRKWCSGL